MKTANTLKSLLNRGHSCLKTLKRHSAALLSVNNLNGSVEIHTGEDGVIQVTAIKQPHTGDEKHTVIELSYEEDGTVKVATRFPGAS
jgi:hypothetical protein